MPNVSPYATYFNNPLIFPDKDGDFPGENAIYSLLNKTKGLIVLYNSTSILGGISGTYAFALRQSGRIYDVDGVTFFSASGYGAGFKDERNESWSVLGEANLFTIGLWRQPSGREGTDYLNAPLPISIGVGAGNVDFYDHGYGTNIGISGGAAISQLNYDKYLSFSITKQEKDFLDQKMAIDETLDVDDLSIGNPKDIFNDKGEVIGQEGELMVRTKGSVFNSKEETIGTGIRMRNMSKDKYKEAWKSESYEKQKTK